MFIINQDRNVMVNTDHIIRVYIANDTRVTAETSCGDDVVLGNYRDRDGRADEVFKDMLSNMFIPNLIAINTNALDNFAENFKKFPTLPWGVALQGENVDIKTVERAAYYMPEE